VVADSNTDTLTLVAGTNVTIETNATNDSITINADSKSTSSVYLVRNNTGSTILKGTLVSASGAEPSGRIDVEPFAAVGGINSELTVMGMATANISNGVNGEVISFGTLTGLDTRGNVASSIAVGDETWAEGDILFAHPTVAGKLTKVRPQHDLAVAFITVRHASTGQIAVRIVPGNNHLEWMHDVLISSVAEDQVLRYNESASVWMNTAENIITAKNVNESTTINAFMPVYIDTETLGQNQILFDVALATGSVSNARMPANAITTASVAGGAFTKLVTHGVVKGLTIAGWSDGDVLYVAPEGGLTNVKPTGNNSIQPFARVLSVDNGTIYVLGNSFVSYIENLPNLETNKVWLGTSGRPVQTTLNTSFINENTNLYFTDERAQDAAADLFTSGVHTGASVEYNDSTGKINITNTGVTALYGTANEIEVSSNTGGVTIGIPNSPIFVTPNIGVATATSITVGDAIVKTTTTTFSSTAATTIATFPVTPGNCIAVECIVLISSTSNGSYTSSKVLITADPDFNAVADITEYAVIRNNDYDLFPVLTATISGSNVLLRAAVSDATATTAKVISTSILGPQGAA